MYFKILFLTNKNLTKILQLEKKITKNFKPIKKLQKNLQLVKKIYKYFKQVKKNYKKFKTKQNILKINYEKISFLDTLLIPELLQLNSSFRS